MAKFHGIVGYGDSQETPAGSGIWVDSITEAPYSGDVVRNSRNLESTEHLNDDITVDNSISIIADPYAFAHWHLIKYISWEGVRWKVNNVEVRRPRLILTIGSVYNGPTN